MLSRRRFLAVPFVAASTSPVLTARRASAPTWRVGIIGHTGQGNYGHAMDVAWLRIPGVVIGGVADAHVEGLAAARVRLGGVPGFASYREMLARTRPDIVVVCPRHAHEHHDMIVAALEGGARAVYVEKPFVRTCAEADAVIAHVRRTRARLAVAHRNRYHPALPALRRFVEGGALGRVIEIRARGKEDHRGGGQDLRVLGGHLFDIARLFTGDAIGCVASILEQGRPATRADVRDGDEGVGRLVGDEIHASFDTARGVPLFYDSTKGRGSTAAGFGLQIYCEGGVVDLRLDMEPLVHVRQGSPFRPDTTPRAWLPFSSGGLDVPEPIAHVSSLVLDHGAAIADLVESMDTGREPLCGPAAARATIEMTQAVFASFAAGSRVTMPLAQRESPL